MDLQEFTTSQSGVRLGMILGKLLPPKAGYQLSGWIAKILARRDDSPMVQAVRQNQWVVRGGNLSPTDLYAAVLEVFTHAGRCFVDLYYNLRHPARIKSKVKDSPRAQQLCRLSRERDLGAFIVAPHLSNFDLCLLSMAYRGLQAQVLSYAQPTGGYEIQNRIRAETGLEITPITPEAHKQAIENLKTGGFVITAVDRPIPGKARTLTFFGRPSPLPAGHIRMALEAGVPIIVASARMDEQGYYHMDFSDPIPLAQKEDREATIRFNGEAVLQVIAERIQANPGQWLMYYPLWPAAVIPSGQR